MNPIKDARQRAGLTQVELSERSGVPQSTISRLETAGLRLLSEDSPIAKIAGVLGVSVAELIGGGDKCE